MIRSLSTQVAALLLGAAGALVFSDPGGAASGRNYYVDAGQGSDEHAGTSRKQAWRSLAKVNATTFGPGDRILLRRGGTYPGGLDLKGSGAPGAPVRLGAYGEEARPHVRAGASGICVSLVDGEQWEVSGLELSGGRCGVFVHARALSIAHHLHFGDLQIHDIHGGLTGDDGGFLLKCEGNKTSFDDVLIEGCGIEHADRNGILLTDWPPHADSRKSTRVVIRGNSLNDIGGDGIFILGCEGALIEKNVLRYAHQRVGRGPGERACAGIWPQRSRNTLIQFNEVSHTAVGGKTIWDSEAFDDDIGCTGSVFQYNYSHDNAGGFLLLCGNTRGTVARYNISQNDGIATFSIEGEVRDASIYNNTVYVGAGREVNLARNTFGKPDGVLFRNNLFHAAGSMRYDFGSIRNLRFGGNAFFGSHVQPPADPRAVTTDPLLADPGSGGDGLETLAGYRLRPGSPCVGVGCPIPNNGGRDFWGARLPRRGNPDIGAHQQERR